jgi:hypothetical protein
LRSRKQLDGRLTTNEGETAPTGGIPDFGALTLPFALENYPDLVR